MTPEEETHLNSVKSRLEAILGVPLERDNEDFSFMLPNMEVRTRALIAINGRLPEGFQKIAEAFSNVVARSNQEHVSSVTNPSARIRIKSDQLKTDKAETILNSLSTQSGRFPINMHELFAEYNEQIQQPER